MIHDASVEVTCDGRRCRESIHVALPFVYPDYTGKGGRYDHDDGEVERKVERQGWTVKDGKHYCPGCAGDEGGEGLMGKTVKVLFALAVFGSLLGCTDAELSRWGALGDAAHVQCYSGGVLIYDGVSTGKVANSEGSDGYEFRDAKDQKLKQVSGDCVLTYAPTAETVAAEANP